MSGIWPGYLFNPFHIIPRWCCLEMPYSTELYAVFLFIWLVYQKFSKIFAGYVCVMYFQYDFSWLCQVELPGFPQDVNLIILSNLCWLMFPSILFERQDVCAEQFYHVASIILVPVSYAIGYLWMFSTVGWAAKFQNIILVVPRLNALILRNNYELFSFCFENSLPITDG